MRSKFIPSFIQGINLTQTGFWFQKRLLIWNWSTKNDKQHWYDSDWKISFRKKKKKPKRSHKTWSTVTKLVGNGIMSSTDENAVWWASIVNMLLLLQRVKWNSHSENKVQYRNNIISLIKTKKKNQKIVGFDFLQMGPLVGHCTGYLLVFQWDKTLFFILQSDERKNILSNFKNGSQNDINHLTRR